MNCKFGSIIAQSGHFIHAVGWNRGRFKAENRPFAAGKIVVRALQVWPGREDGCTRGSFPGERGSVTVECRM